MYLKIVVLLTLILINLYAGGDYRDGEIISFVQNGKLTTFKFEQIQKDITPLIESCYQIVVELKYERVPWYSRKSFHPTLEQNLKAIKSIKRAFENNQKIYFGYMGRGFRNTDQKCHFKSRGVLEIKRIDGVEVILSFYF